jgi:DNA-directed RNA polymerase subunit RPC12/RpoP
MEAVQKARCVSCRTDVAVPDSYQHGDHIKCGSCGTKHKVVRGDVLRLVLADVAPLREAFNANEALVSRLEAELHHARASFGIGANGFGIALIFALYQIGMNDRGIDATLLMETAMVAVASGVLLEAVNFFFLAKRQAIRRLATELQDARADSRELQRKIREGSRV